MRLPDPRRAIAADSGLPRWPPLLATRGPGGETSPHAHHAMHLMIAIDGMLRVKAGDNGRWQRAAGVVTAPDLQHAIDAAGCDVLLVFVNPESDVGASIASTIGGPFRLISDAERAALASGADPMAIMREGGDDWTARAVELLGGSAVAARRSIHPRVRRLLRILASGAPDESLEALATAVNLSPGRLMHVFTESIGIPLRPYLAWLRLQRAAGAIVSGAPLSVAAHRAGFADAAHMTRTFRKMFGIPPSALRPRAA